MAKTYGVITRGKFGKVVTDHTHDQLHHGRLFTSDVEFEGLASGAFLDILFSTSSDCVHFLWFLHAEDSAIFKIFEASSCTTSSDYSIINANRNLAAISTTAVMVQEVSTIVTSGTLVRTEQIRARKGLGHGPGFKQEIELKPDTLYRMSLESKAANNEGMLGFTFYEG